MQYRIAFIMGLLCLSHPLHAERAAFTLPNGDRYEGDVFDGVLSGSGVYEWADGDRYEGEFNDDLPSGQGLYIWADGRRYEGEFVDGKRQGYGSLTWANGDVYEGDFFANYMQGNGTFRWATGDRYVGSFMANKRHGAGSMSWAEGQRYDGEFQNDTLHGQGIYQWPDGRYFKGAFLGGQRTGLGVFRASDGTLFRGFFVDGLRHGHLIKWPPQGNRFLEEYRAGALIESSLLAVNSRCKFSNVNGEWMVKADACINGLAHGIGKAASVTGLELVENGEWVLGELVAGTIVVLPQLTHETALSLTSSGPLGFAGIEE
ncbi:MAG: hypothetical protein VXZ70_00455 [Pseudomonadota bacterium]|nr:hypothetical protein [Pseudomonadota bacterium]